MKGSMEILLLFVVCLVSIGGGMASKQIQGGSMPLWIPAIPALITGLLWGYGSKITGNISRLSIAFDISISVSYMLGLIFMGERLGTTQLLGFLVALVGLIMMS